MAWGGDAVGKGGVGVVPRQGWARGGHGCGEVAAGWWDRGGRSASGERGEDLRGEGEKERKNGGGGWVENVHEDRPRVSARVGLGRWIRKHPTVVDA